MQFLRIKAVLLQRCVNFKLCVTENLRKIGKSAAHALKLLLSKTKNHQIYSGNVEESFLILDYF